MLVEWGYAKSTIQVNTDEGTLSFASKEVLKIEVKDFELKMSWSDGSWEDWCELQSSDALCAIKMSNQEKLDLAKASAGKGKGKGPTSSS